MLNFEPRHLNELCSTLNHVYLVFERIMFNFEPRSYCSTGNATCSTLNAQSYCLVYERIMLNLEPRSLLFNFERNMFNFERKITFV